MARVPLSGCGAAARYPAKVSLRLAIVPTAILSLAAGPGQGADRPVPPEKPAAPNAIVRPPSAPVGPTRPMPPDKPKSSADRGSRFSVMPVPSIRKPLPPDPPADQEVSNTHSDPAPLPETVVAKAQKAISDARGCRIAEPFSVAAMGQEPVRLKPAALISVRLVPLLLAWVDKDLQPAARKHFSVPVEDLVISSSYVCRTRNNAPGAKLSEHALGNAVDISAFRLKNGTVVSVDADWADDTPGGKFLKSVHRAACAHFTTVLGPDADDHHKTHFHLDRGKHGKTGTYRICQ